MLRSAWEIEPRMNHPEKCITYDQIDGVPPNRLTYIIHHASRSCAFLSPIRSVDQGWYRILASCLYPATNRIQRKRWATRTIFMSTLRKLSIDSYSGAIWCIYCVSSMTWPPPIRQLNTAFRHAPQLWWASVFVILYSFSCHVESSELLSSDSMRPRPNTIRIAVGLRNRGCQSLVGVERLRVGLILQPFRSSSTLYLFCHTSDCMSRR